jgi:hypothetical protein
VSYTALADGSHTFLVLAVDPAGNTDPTPAGPYAWVVDTTVAERAWGDITTLSNELYDATNPATAMADDGTIWAVWLEESTPNALYAARLAVGEVQWDQAVQIDNGLGGIERYRFNYLYYSRVNPQIATGGGNTVAVWTQDDGASVSLYANIHDGSAWVGPSAIDSRSGVDAGNARIVVDEYGDATIVWRMDDANGKRLYTSRYIQASSTWTSPMLISQSTMVVDKPSSPELILTHLGHPAVAWFETRNNVQTGLYYSEYEGADWSVPVLISEGTFLSVAMASSTDDQQPVLTWVKIDEFGNYSVYVARRTDSGWSAPLVVEAMPDDAKSSDITAMPDGKLFVAFNNGGTSSLYIDAYVVGYAPDSGWAEPLLIYDLGGTMPRIASDGYGNAMLLWYASQTFGSMYTPADGWSFPSKWFGYNLGLSHDIKMNSAGDAVAIWSSDWSSEADKVQVSVYR